MDRLVAPDGTEGYSVEVFNAESDTNRIAPLRYFVLCPSHFVLSFATVPADVLEPLREDEIFCARTLAG